MIGPTISHESIIENNCEKKIVNVIFFVHSLNYSFDFICFIFLVHWVMFIKSQKDTAKGKKYNFFFGMRRVSYGVTSLSSGTRINL